ncbi:unnamed protein product [Adineta steineri]|uniref:inositol-phosphate phosphatase n=1 Tax=Adineta steineri TaxID=433720 RepID=A0A818ZB38_9BILA|nr:unnamed protein product [Adineta steineri]CAF1437092.1 unnamed protein product [Adineta steineri]CAF3761656.1 unnamed protein product [Adineta steineri]CAF3768888.1 unnamed protein product [Adineta steineri]
MFGVKFHPHRSLLIVGVLGCFLIIFILLSYKEKKNTIIKQIQIDNDEDINLIDLFNNAFKLTYQAGHAIKLFKNKNNNLGKILKKKSFENLPSEPVTIADVISHSIITNGLKNKFQNLQIVSEEKDPLDKKAFQLIKEEFNVENQLPNIPIIKDDENLMKVPLSSVAVWVDPLDATKEFTENLLQYVMVMLCITIEKKPTIGILYAPFTDKLIWGWVGVDRSHIKRDENSLLETHKPNIDEIILSRSHAGDTHEILKKIYHDKQYRIIPAAGSGYKTVQVLEEYADYYLHTTPIKKWDLCAPDAILRANNGMMTTLKNQTISYDHENTNMLITDGLLATYKRDHNEVIKFLMESNLTKYISKKKH